MSGRSGTLRYSEHGRGTQTFNCEFGGGDTMLVVYAPSASEWAAAILWAADRRQEILERLAGEVIRQKAPGCRFVVPEGGVNILERGAR